MFAVAILLIEDQHELHDLLQHDLLTPYNCNKPHLIIIEFRYRKPSYNCMGDTP